MTAGLVLALFLSPSWWIRLVLSGASAIPWITRAAVLAGRRFSVHPSQAIPLAFQRLSSTLTRALVNIVRVNADDFPPSSSPLCAKATRENSEHPCPLSVANSKGKKERKN